MKIRIKFRKYGALKFVGHLDMMRYFQKALKRAGIDMKYSEGFNPHMIMSLLHRLASGSPVTENILTLRYFLRSQRKNP